MPSGAPKVNVTYFVVASNGSDSNTGTISSPFATLARCAVAMEGSSTKLCYVRGGSGGSYTPAPATAAGFGCNNNSPAPANLLLLSHAKGDDGVTFSYYPPDGYNSAIFDGSATSSTTGIPTAICAQDVKNVNIVGLAFQHFRRSAIQVTNWSANDTSGQNNSITANLIQNSGYTTNPAINCSGWVQGTKIYNNAILHVSGHGIGCFTAQSSTAQGLTNLDIEQNVVVDACGLSSDNGSIYIQDYQSPRSTNIKIKNNYLYQCNVGGTGGKLIYLDDGTWNVTATLNEMIAAGPLYAAVQIHGGNNNTFQTNVIDEGGGTRILFYQQSTTAPGTMTGNAWLTSYIVCLSSGTCGNGYVGGNTPPNPQSNPGSTYFNYGTGGAVNTSGSGGAAADASPTYSNPSLTCWVTPIPGQPAVSYGPPGFAIPQTGPQPSWCAGMTPPAGTFFVATTGNDGNTGTLASPFLTLGKCQTAMQAVGVPRTCYVRGGTYTLSSGITLGASDAGETWSYYSADGLYSPALKQSSAFPYFRLNAGADNVTIKGFGATGFQHISHGGCGSAFFVYSPTNSNVSNPTITYNYLNIFDCAVFLGESINPVLSYNRVSNVEYAGLFCNACVGAAAQSVWTGNIVWDINPDGTSRSGVNAYGITISTNTAVTAQSSNITVSNNQVYNNKTWECYDLHGGTNIFFTNNLAVGCDTFATAAFESFAPGTGLITINNVQQNDNIFDNGFQGTNGTAPGFSYEICGTGCSTNAQISSGTLANNTEMTGAANGPKYIVAPIVAVSGHISHLDPETVSSITFTGGATSASATHGVANGVVGTLAVNMSDTKWAFPLGQPGPGVLSIGGTNSGGFVICNGYQICQSAGGTAAGTYNDFSVTATLHGMSGSPATIAAGVLTITML
jgi:hypothetical protein